VNAQQRPQHRGFVPPLVPILTIASIARRRGLAAARTPGRLGPFVATAVGLICLVATNLLEPVSEVMVSEHLAGVRPSPIEQLPPPRRSNTLKVMTIVALIFTPLVLLYQGWSLLGLPRRLRQACAARPVAPVAGTGFDTSPLTESGTS